jgi:hypothetical protein
MKINRVGAWLLCYAVVPLLLLVVYSMDPGTQTFILANPGGGEFGSVSAAGDASGRPAVSRAGTLFVRGWVVDQVGGGPLQNVVVSVDRINVGVATLSATRGWNFQMPAITLGVGRHSVTANASGLIRTVPLGEGKTINVTTQGGK